ncbi:Os02g0245100, partial [Oryza sativa Japonica Group]
GQVFPKSHHPRPGSGDHRFLAAADDDAGVQGAGAGLLRALQPVPRAAPPRGRLPALRISRQRPPPRPRPLRRRRPGGRAGAPAGVRLPDLRRAVRLRVVGVPRVPLRTFRGHEYCVYATRTSSPPRPATAPPASGTCASRRPRWSSRRTTTRCSRSTGTSTIRPSSPPAPSTSRSASGTSARRGRRWRSSPGTGTPSSASSSRRTGRACSCPAPTT